MGQDRQVTQSVGLFCQKAQEKRRYSAKETYDLIVFKTTSDTPLICHSVTRQDRHDKIVGLFGRIASLLWDSFAKETYKRWVSFYLSCLVTEWQMSGVSLVRPTQSIMYVPLQVNRFRKIILLIIQYKYLKSCSRRFYCPNLILRTRLCGTMFITQPSCLFYFHLTECVRWKWFVLAVYQFWKGILAGPALKHFTWFIGAGGSLVVTAIDCLFSSCLVTFTGAMRCLPLPLSHVFIWLSTSITHQACTMSHTLYSPLQHSSQQKSLLTSSSDSTTDSEKLELSPITDWVSSSLFLCPSLPRSLAPSLPRPLAPSLPRFLGPILDPTSEWIQYLSWLCFEYVYIVKLCNFIFLEIYDFTLSAHILLIDSPPQQSRRPAQCLPESET